MSDKKNSISRAITVTIVMSVVASVVVSFVAVYLKDLQDSNKLFDKQKNILTVAGLISQGEQVSKQQADELYKNIDIYLVDFDTGEKVKQDPNTYDQKLASKNVNMSKQLDPNIDIASIKRREDIGFVYEVKKDGKLDTIVVPIRGYGLWSTLYGFLALSGDAKTVKGITYYEHAETPGLGGEVDNPRWKQVWVGKTAYDQNNQVVLHVIKGVAPSSSKTEIDGLSGATITSRGVDNMIKFWLGENGYKKFFENNYF